MLARQPCRGFRHLRHRLQYLSFDTINPGTTLPHCQSHPTRRASQTIKICLLSSTPIFPHIPSASLYLPPQSTSEQAPSAKAGLRAWLSDKHIHSRIASPATLRDLYWSFTLISCAESLADCYRYLHYCGIRRSCWWR